MGPRITMTVGQKRKIREYHATTRCTHLEVTNWARSHFGVPVARSTITKILTANLEDDAADDQKRMRVPRFPALDDALLQFVLEYQEAEETDGVNLTESMLVDKAQQLCVEMKISQDDLKLSNGWLDRFKKRHGLCLRTRKGKARSLGTIAQFRSYLGELISEYRPHDVFNMDTANLFFRVEPSKSVALSENRGKNKKEHERVTVILCASMDGSEKSELAVIGKSTNPRSFGGNNLQSLALRYYVDKESALTESIFTDWLQAFNSRMQGRKVLLLVNSARGRESQDLPNVRVEVLPKKTPALLHPMDAGAIKAFKLLYKMLYLQFLTDGMQVTQQKPCIDLFAAILFMLDAWKRVTPASIRHCWWGTRLMPPTLVAQLRQEDQHFQNTNYTHLQTLVERLQLSDPVDAVQYVDELYVEAKDTKNKDEEDEDEDEGISKTSVLGHREALGYALQLKMYLLAAPTATQHEHDAIDAVIAKCRQAVESESSTQT